MDDGYSVDHYLGGRLSDIAHPSYQANLASLIGMHDSLFMECELLEVHRNEWAFKCASESIAYSGTNVTYGRLRKEVLRMVADGDFQPID